MPSPRRPREFFGLSAQPLPGTEYPTLPDAVQQRFDQAGYGAFAPYAAPYETLARAKQYRQFNDDVETEDMEDQFMQAIRDNPQTGMQRFLAENPLSLTSPLIRNYALTQQRLMGRPQKDKGDPLAAKAAEGGTDALKAYYGAGGDVAGFAAAQDAMAKAKASAKPERPWQQRLSESEREKVRQTIELAKNFEDFQTEFDAVLKKNPGITKDEYVKKFKGDADYDSYVRRRLAQEKADSIIPRLVDDYGLTEAEAATVLGVGKNVPRGTQPISQEDVPPAQGAINPPSYQLPFAEKPAGSAPSAPQAPVPEPPPVVPSISERRTPPPPSEAEKLKQAEEISRGVKGILNEEWTAAKGELASALDSKKGHKLKDDPELLKSLLRSVQLGEVILPEDIGLEGSKDFLGGERQSAAVDLLAKFLGKDPDAVAEVSIRGGKKAPLADKTTTHTWRDVVKAWADEQLPKSANPASRTSDYSSLWGGK